MAVLRCTKPKHKIQYHCYITIKSFVKECKDIILFKIDTNNGPGVNLTFDERNLRGHEEMERQEKSTCLNVHIKAIYASNVKPIKNIPEILHRKRKGNHETMWKNKIKEL